MEKPMNVTQKLIKSHLLSGEMKPGEEISLKIDQVLQQDATGTLIMLELEAMGVDRIKTEKAVQYVDHNLLQADYKNADDHKFLQSAAAKFGYWYSRPGNGISHVVHMERFGVPGKSMLGSDSHTCSGGALGMLAIGTGGVDVGMAAVGEPYYVVMPKVLGIELTGELSEWVSAKDVILEMLRRYDVKGGRGYIVEYFGDGVKNLSAWDRHVIANMGAELGATTTVFPSDERTREHLEFEQRPQDWVELLADKDAKYDDTDHIDLSKLEPLIACPSSPGNVVSVSEVEGKKISQVVVGSSANPGLRDFWIVSEMIKDRYVHNNVSLDINPSSREVIQNLGILGSFPVIINAGARFHQTGCMGCIGMGQAPASHEISLRTMPRNFPGRSGTEDDQVYLCSPETAAASALSGEISNPVRYAQQHGLKYPQFHWPDELKINKMMLISPKENNDEVEIYKGPNIKTLPEFEAIRDEYELPVLLKMEDNVSTDEILKAGAEVLPLRSNIVAISEYAFSVIDKDFVKRAKKVQNDGHSVVAGENYAQGSSREHAALAPRYLGQKLVLAKSYARIGWQNLVNFGILPLEFQDPGDYDQINQDDILIIKNIHKALENAEDIEVKVKSSRKSIEVKHSLSERQKKIILSGGIINFLKSKIN
jgi:aconitate hydratase